MNQRVKPWQVALAAVAAAALVIVIGSRALRSAPIRSQAPAGVNPRHYEEEFGPRAGLLDEMKQKGLVPADAIDDGRGHFVSPSRLTPAELRLAEQVARAREARRTARRGR